MGRRDSRGELLTREDEVEDSCGYFFGKLLIGDEMRGTEDGEISRSVSE